MKKLILSLVIAGASITQAQINVEAKANVLFNAKSASWKELKGSATEAFKTKGDNSVGYNVGLGARIELPVTDLFVMPELYYTHFKNSVTIDGVDIDAKSNRIDIPVMVGYQFLGNMVSAFVGPVASFNLEKDGRFNDFIESGKDDFSLGYQLGANVKISKLLINARYESAFSKDQRSFINKVTNTELRYDNRANFFILGLGYQF